MKRMLIVLIAATLIAAFVSASQPQASADRNKAAVRYVLERSWNEAAFDSLSTYWAPDVPFHFRGRASPVGPDGVRAQVTSWRRALSDFRFTIDDIIAEGDRVAVRLTFTGTHRARFMGVDSSGRAISITEMMFFRLANGRVVEAWEDYDEYALRRQLAGQ